MREHINRKVKAFREAGIVFNKAQIAHMRKLKNEVQVDNYARDFLFPKLEMPRDANVWCGNV